MATGKKQENKKTRKPRRVVGVPIQTSGQENKKARKPESKKIFKPSSSQKNSGGKASNKTAKRAPGTEESAGEGKTVKGVKVPSLLRGMKDILPKEGKMWQHIRHTAEKIAEAYGFGYIETPVLEEAGLFTRSIGRGTDVVEKEMYVFEDRDGSKVGLRPELTASVARAYIGHGMQSLPQPVKMWYLGPMFRHDRPQAGRYREFHQFDCETIGERDPLNDAELIVVAYNFFRDLGIATQVHINSIGSLEDRARYTVELLGYLRLKRSYLCEDCKRRMQKNPLRVLDCKVEQCRAQIVDAPQIIDWLSEDAKNYFMKVLEYLDTMDIPYILQSTLVRGLDYYTDTVFEFYRETTEEGGAQSALGGGGRYDGLLEQLGGRSVPACGFALGIERVISALRREQEGQPEAKEVGISKVYFAQLGEQARRRALFLIEDLRRNEVFVQHNLGKTSLKGQLELANRFGATHALILGQKEVQDGTIIVRDMESGIQEIIDQKKIKGELEKIMR